jgi:tetratricopeptide (TPR) repeat protein
VAQFYERAIQITLAMSDWCNSGIIAGNLSSLHTALGNLQKAIYFGEDSVKFARRAYVTTPDATKFMLISGEVSSLCNLAWTNYLMGRLEIAERTFKDADKVQRRVAPDSLMYGMNDYIDYLRRTGKISVTRRLIKIRQEVFADYSDEQSMTYRLLGDLESGAKRQENARRYYDEAVKIARLISRRDVLIEALLARGQWANRNGKLDLARNDLGDALGLARSSGYRLFEADARLGLAWTSLATRELSQCRHQAGSAQQMSEEMEYYWGQESARNLLLSVGEAK